MKLFFAGSPIALGIAAANVSVTPTYQVKGRSGGGTLNFSDIKIDHDPAKVKVDKSDK